MRDAFPRTAQACLLAGLTSRPGSSAGNAMAQEKKVAQVNGVDNRKMGPYLALARHCAFQD